MYNFPGPATNIPPQVGDTLTWNGQLWVPSSSTEESNVITQAEWAIDFIDGDDSADGTPDHPLRTGAEFTKRTLGKGLDSFVRLDILNDCPNPNEDYLFINSPVLNTSGFLRIGGNSSTILATATISNVNNQVANTSQTTIEASEDLSAFIGKRIRVISSATAPIGTIAYIEAANAGVYTISTPAYQDTSTAGNWNNSVVRVLSNGDSIVVEDLFQAPQLSLDVFGSGNMVASPFGHAIGITDLRVGQPTRLDILNMSLFGRAVAWGCQLDIGELQCAVGGPLSNITACRFRNNFNVLGIEGQPIFVSCSFLTSISTIYPATWLGFLNNNSIRGGRIQLDHASRAQINGLTIQEWPVISGIGAALHIQEGCFVNMGSVLWGTSTLANTYGIRVDAYGGCVYPPASKPTIAGTLTPGKDVEVGGVSLAYAAVPSFNINNGAALVVKN